MIESSRSEKRLGGKYIAFKSAAETTRNSIIKEENLKLEEKRRREKIAEFGSGKNTIDGTIDRVNKLPYDPNKFPKKEDQQSYYYGYYYRGSRVLYGMIERNRVKNITSLGMDDYALGVTVEQLGMLKNVPEYMSGYNMMAKKFEEGKAVKK